MFGAETENYNKKLIMLPFNFVMKDIHSLSYLVRVLVKATTMPIFKCMLVAFQFMKEQALGLAATMQIWFVQKL